MLVLDTSAVLAATLSDDPKHEVIKHVLSSDRGPLIVPAGACCEIGYLLGRKGAQPVARFVRALDTGALRLDCGEDDLARVAELILRYDDLPLGYTDAAVVACAERLEAAVVTLDRDFSVVAQEGTIRVLPDLS